jgi:hypothetical protein
MGMFDYVDYKDGVCPKCRASLEGWQSKDGECLLETLLPSQVDDFHTICDSCGAYIQAHVEKQIEVLDIVLSIRD